MKCGHSIFAIFFLLSFTSAFAQPPFSVNNQDGKSSGVEGTLRDIPERKQEVNELCCRMGEPVRFSSQETFAVDSKKTEI